MNIILSLLRALLTKILKQKSSVLPIFYYNIMISLLIFYYEIRHSVSKKSKINKSFNPNLFNELQLRRSVLCMYSNYSYFLIKKESHIKYLNQSPERMQTILQSYFSRVFSRR